MKSYKEPKPIVIAEYFQFHHQDQKEEETLVQHIAQLHKLTENCELQNNVNVAL